MNNPGSFDPASCPYAAQATGAEIRYNPFIDTRPANMAFHVAETIDPFLMVSLAPILNNERFMLTESIIEATSRFLVTSPIQLRTFHPPHADFNTVYRSERHSIEIVQCEDFAWRLPNLFDHASRIPGIEGTEWSAAAIQGQTTALNPETFAFQTLRARRLGTYLNELYVLIQPSFIENDVSQPDNERAWFLVPRFSLDRISVAEMYVYLTALDPPHPIPIMFSNSFTYANRSRSHREGIINVRSQSSWQQLDNEAVGLHVFRFDNERQQIDWNLLTHSSLNWVRPDETLQAAQLRPDSLSGLLENCSIVNWSQ